MFFFWLNVFVYIYKNFLKEFLGNLYLDDFKHENEASSSDVSIDDLDDSVIDDLDDLTEDENSSDNDYMDLDLIE